MEDPSALLLLFLDITLLLSTCAAVDTLLVNQGIDDGSTVVSEGEIFELGFFSPGNSKKRYLGIWYKTISTRTVVWVANRETPISDKLAMFKVSREGNLMILSGDDSVIWSSNSTVSVSNLNPVVQLLDTGNLVLWEWDGSSTGKSLIWQNFDYIGNTVLPGMKYGKDLVTGRERYMTSWKSIDDPSPGMYSNIIDTNGYPQVFQRRGRIILWRFGPWNGVGFSGFTSDVANTVYSFEFVFNQTDIYVKYELISSVVQRVVLTSDGKTLMLHWIERMKDWVVYADVEVDGCGRYALCGPYGSCNINNRPPCSCMDGFEPRVPEQWTSSDWSSGCHRKEPLHCGSLDVFWKISRVKLPDTRWSRYNASMSLGECETACRNNCSCTAYANLDVRKGGSGCLMWFGDLMDIREYDGDYQKLYIRLAAGHIVTHPSFNGTEGILMVTVSTSLAVLLLSGVVFVYRTKKKRRDMKGRGNERLLDKGNTSLQKEYLDEVPFFSLLEITKATNNFSIHNKIGEGGFGPVYKMKP